MQSTLKNSPSLMSGVTLVELMVSILLGSLLALGMVKVYLESVRQFVADEDMARIQENGRFALNLLGRELMHAGFYGGQFAMGELPSGNVSKDCVVSGNWSLDALYAIEHIDDFSGGLVTGAGTAFSCIKSSRVQPGTDVFSVKRTANTPSLKNGRYPIGLKGARDTQWYLRVRDYGASKSWFYNKTLGFPAHDVTHGSKTDYWEMYAKVFYLRKYATVSSDSFPTLCVAMLAGNGIDTECVIEGIEDMQLDYGIDMDGDGVANQFLSDPNAPQIAGAVSARVSLLLRGATPISGYINRKSFQLGAKQVAPKHDAYLRRVMTSTVQLRNSANTGSEY